jgi:hypothetical protein
MDIACKKNDFGKEEAQALNSIYLTIIKEIKSIYLTIVNIIITFTIVKQIAEV